MERKKILWLVSWYPNKTDRFDGDFIQRHARAAAIHHDIHVIFVKGIVGQETQTEECNSGCGLTEQIIYFSKRENKFAAVFNFLRWRSLYLKAVADYEKKNGRPAWVHVHVPWKTGLIALELKKRKGWEYFVTEHWGIYTRLFKDSFYNWFFLKRLLMVLVYRSAAITSVPSCYLGKKIQEAELIKRFEVLPNVVDTQLFNHHAECPEQEYFIHISNLKPVKNFDIILEQFETLARLSSPIKLLIVGNDNDVFTKLVQEKGLSNNITFLGLVNQFEVSFQLKRSKALVLFSEDETFSCVVAEALCCGVPVISSKVGAIPELVNENNGILISLEHPDYLIQVLNLIESNSIIFDRHSIAEKAQNKYSYASIAELFRNLYQVSSNLTPD